MSAGGQRGYADGNCGSRGAGGMYGGVCGAATGVGVGAAGVVGAVAGIPAALRIIAESGSTRSIGNGKMIVEFFSTAISVSVCR